MAVHEEKDEEVTFKVSDRRKFNPDGSLKEGVTLEAAKPEEKPKAATAPEPSAAKENVRESAAGSEVQPADHSEDEDDIPGAEDPASFVNFLSTLATNAAASLGAMPHPATGKRTVDLESGKYWVDVLAMLREKTRGNLHAQETRLLEGILGDLRMQYVQMAKAAEEKLKAQAAQKFSNADILGKK